VYRNGSRPSFLFGIKRLKAYSLGLETPIFYPRPVPWATGEHRPVSFILPLTGHCAARQDVTLDCRFLASRMLRRLRGGPARCSATKKNHSQLTDTNRKAHVAAAVYALAMTRASPFCRCTCATNALRGVPGIQSFVELAGSRRALA
jgi:hypothetical protein